MKRPSFSPSLCGLAWGCLLVAGTLVSADELQAPGVVRISKPASGVTPTSASVTPSSDAATVTIRGQSDDVELIGCKDCERGFVGHHGGAGSYHSHGGYHGHTHGLFAGKHSHSEFCECEKYGLGSRRFGQSECDICGKRFGGKGGPVLEYFKCKFGYFFPTGCGGAGCPPIGKYARVYPQDPSYFDQRDGQVYGAHGYGVPMSVPLAPVVGHQYNYSWGTPSSRLTPISRIAPY